MSGKAVLVPSIKDWGLSVPLETYFLLRWEERLKDRFYPVLNRNSPLHSDRVFDNLDDYILLVCRLCRIRGKTDPQRLSHLARSILHRISPTILEKLLQPGSILAEESPDALKRSLSNEPQKLAVLLAHIRTDHSYSL